MTKMNSTNESLWLQSVISLTDGYEVEAVERFTNRLVRLAHSRLPTRLNPRVDPEDIVQSVFSSFFKGNEKQQFEFKNSNDLWRLLAAMTYYKVMTAIEFHGRDRRNFTKEIIGTNPNDVGSSAQHEDATVSGLAMMTELLEQILDQLPETHQRILQLRLEDYTIDEIAERVEVSSRTVNRALKHVRTIAEQLVGNDGQ